MYSKTAYLKYQLYKTGFLVAITTFFAAFAMSQAPSIKASIDKKDIIIGEQIHYKVEAVFSPGTYSLHWLTLPDSIPHFEVVEQAPPDTAEDNGIRKVSQLITLTSFDSGKYVIPSFSVGFSPAGEDSTINLHTDSLPINIGYSPMDSVKTFHDIKPIIEVQDKWPLWKWAVLIGSILLLIALILFIVKRSKKKKDTGIFSSKLTPYDEAMKELSALKAQGLLSKGEIKQYHTKLADIFKIFISRKYNENIFNKTTSEVLVRLNALEVPKPQIAELASCLRIGDAVKFAKYTPPTFESEDAFDRVKQFIELNGQPLPGSKEQTQNKENRAS